MKKFKLTLTVLILFISIYANAQSDDQTAVKNTIMQFFDGMKTTDSLKLKETLAPNCSLRSIGRTKTGESKVNEAKMEGFIKSIGTKHDGIYDERIMSYDIKIDDNMAIAWTPYEFYISDKFSHCGVNVFTMVKTDKGWKIAGIIDTRRKENCVK
jgi:hypothetical protein